MHEANIQATAAAPVIPNAHRNMVPSCSLALVRAFARAFGVLVREAAARAELAGFARDWEIGNPHCGQAAAASEI